MIRRASSQNLDVIFGFGGMHPDENPRARHWAERFEVPMMLVAVWIFIEWHLISKGAISAHTITLMDWAFWGFFTIETAVLSFLASDAGRYLKRNWLNVFIVVLGLPIWFEILNQVGVLRALRLLVLVGYLVHHISIVKTVLARHHLGATLLVGSFLVTMGGLLISAIDPAFKSPADGIWWAWISVTTVGYGDIVPLSTEGRIFGVILILGGIAMISLITATFSAYYFSQEAEKETALEQESIRRIAQLEEHLERLEKKIDQLLK